MNKNKIKSIPKFKNSKFKKYKGILSDNETDKMLELVKKGRRDGSNKKTFLLQR